MFTLDFAGIKLRHHVLNRLNLNEKMWVPRVYLKHSIYSINIVFVSSFPLSLTFFLYCYCRGPGTTSIITQFNKNNKSSFFPPFLQLIKILNKFIYFTFSIIFSYSNNVYYLFFVLAASSSQTRTCSPIKKLFQQFCNFFCFGTVLLKKHNICKLNFAL